MTIEALPFVNWIFWAALTSGTLLVVGLTELLGGTTRGYRLFMAWLLAAFAAVLLLSELNLALGTVADDTAGARRGSWCGPSPAWRPSTWSPRSRSCRGRGWRSPADWSASWPW